MLKWLFNKTLNNVWFGIFMMVMVAAYVAIGSGRPDVREFFEMDEFAFFNAWPFKLIMGLLVASLVTVTFIRIPFTVPRYGVWMIHTGIVLLIYGMSYYYSFKEEGLTFVPKGGTVSTYYDKWDRSLYVRVNNTPTGDEHVLLSLPRFKAYGEDASRLKGQDLHGLEPFFIQRGENNAEKVTPLYQLLGLKDPIRFDVVGYWPYAEISTSYAAGRGDRTGMRLEVVDPAGEVRRKLWVVAEGDAPSHEDLDDLEVEHRNATDAQVQDLVKSAGNIHLLDIGGEKLSVEVGGTYKAGGYEFTVESFDPAWLTMQGETVKLLTLMITPPATAPYKEKFRRQLIPGREKVTDWKLNVEGAGPMGKRQNEPLDPSLVTRYAFNDALGLLPSHGREKRSFVTSPTKTYVLETSLVHGTKLSELEGGKGELKFSEGGPRLRAERLDKLQRVESVMSVPSEKRNRQAASEGLNQVIAVNVSCGSWSQKVHVPFTQWAGTAPWTGGEVRIPGTEAVLQLQLGMRTRLIAPHPKTGIPAQVKLDSFELKSYGGGSQLLMQRDFISTLTIKEGDGKERTGKAHMNSPVYFGGSPMTNIGDTYWTLFQASWDPNGQRFTVLGVGNRPGTWIMTVGAGLMTVGLLYAFYIKPLIIRRMKDRAIAEAKAKGKKVPVAV